ncbi:MULTISPECIES: abortive infection family protein [unclassified Stenotrophomonas]|uniref:abortive infection family protein n=1 Tax=Lysobacteraceae TaxID=32033 RepID=UPI0025DFFC6A|nr:MULTISPECIES: abortive infection family protein [unclassified Stenotrophomonas]MBW8375001.1 abortive infection family protein [Stenotrophomonas sp.]MDY0978620.1 abortive infection family protein [Stenotrophomonas sp. CFBP8994]
MLKEFPKPLAATIGDVVGSYYYSHRRLETMLYEAGASGDVPEGNCVDKVQNWLVREGKEDVSKAFTILGKLIETLMDGEVSTWDPDKELTARKRINEILARYQLSYGFGGRILGAHSVTAPSKAFGEALKDFSVAEVEEEFERAVRFIDSDPAAAVTAACAIVEALCKHYIATERLDLPTSQTVKPLWVVVAKHLKLSPEQLEDDDLKRVLSGLSSIIDGLGAYRTHAGSAHGQHKRAYKVAPRHARLVVHSAHSLCLFVVETWQARKALAKGR